MCLYKKYALNIFVGTIVAISAFPVLQAKAASGNASAAVVSPIEVEETQELSFGTLIPSNILIGTVSVNAGGTFGQGGVTIVSPGTRGHYDVTGINDASYNITIPPIIVLTGPGTPMNALLFSPVIGTIVGGVDDFFVDGVLQVGANQAEGLYTTTFNVDVNY